MFKNAQIKCRERERERLTVKALVQVLHHVGSVEVNSQRLEYLFVLHDYRLYLDYVLEDERVNLLDHVFGAHYANYFSQRQKL